MTTTYWVIQVKHRGSEEWCGKFIYSDEQFGLLMIKDINRIKQEHSFRLVKRIDKVVD